MKERDLVGTLGSLFIAVGLVLIAAVEWGLLGAGVACLPVGVGLGIIASLEG